MTHKVLPVFSSDPDDRLSRRRARYSIGEIADVRVQIAPLSCQQVDDVDVFSRRLKVGRFGCQEVGVRIGRNPARTTQIRISLQCYFELTLSRFDRYFLPNRFELESFRHLDIDFADRQLALERAIDVRVLRVTKQKVRPVVLKPVVVHLMCVTVGRKVTTVGRTEVNAGGGGFSRA